MAKAINQLFERFRAPNPQNTTRNRNSSVPSAKKMQSVKCNCCETRLTNLDKESKSFIAKYPKCTHCRHYVCRNCRESSKCHECHVKLKIVRNPEYLMKMEKQTLLGLLKTLHYEDHIFDNWEKPYLVKQLLTRFQVYEEWDPRRYNATADWVGKSAKITEASRSREASRSKEPSRSKETSRAKEAVNTKSVRSTQDVRAREAAQSMEALQSTKGLNSTEALRLREASRSMEVLNSPEALGPRESSRTVATEETQRPKQKKPSRKSRTDLNLPKDVQKMSFEQVGEHIYSLPCQKKTEVQMRNIAAPAIPRQTRSMNRMPSMSLQDIPSATYFESLDTDEMKSILKKSIDSNSILSQDDLKLVLQILWTNMRKEKNESSTPVNKVQQSEMRPYYSERYLNKIDHDDQFLEQRPHHHSHKHSLAETRRSYASTKEDDDDQNMSHISASMGALNMLDVEEKPKGRRLPTSTSFRETVPGRLTAAKYTGSKKQPPSLQKGRRVKDMRALFEKKDDDDGDEELMY